MPSTITDRLNGLTTSVAVKAPCRVATTAAITLSGLQTLDGIALAALDRVLVKDQASAIANGIYIAGTGAWSRAADFDGSFDAVGGTQLSVVEGTANGGSYWRINSSGPVVFGTDNINFIPGGPSDSAAQSYNSGYTSRATQSRLREEYWIADFPGADATTKLQYGVAQGVRTIRIPVGTTVLEAKISPIAPFKIAGVHKMASKISAPSVNNLTLCSRLWTISGL